ncbi:uncharacterized protein LOC131613176 [Vicia villosa]|uniref:uncharacterized protein LOC131613176 n=1 Tax=Vicia villosa TaxID=3911 RepID=UPI00273BA7C4|nr:uncharacterized protein LOC131613176 [Vicia villosa]
MSMVPFEMERDTHIPCTVVVIDTLNVVLLYAKGNSSDFGLSRGVELCLGQLESFLMEDPACTLTDLFSDAGLYVDSDWHSTTNRMLRFIVLGIGSLKKWTGFINSEVI